MKTIIPCEHDFNWLTVNRVNDETLSISYCCRKCGARKRGLAKIDKKLGLRGRWIK